MSESHLLPCQSDKCIYTEPLNEIDKALKHAHCPAFTEMMGASLCLSEEDCVYAALHAHAETYMDAEPDEDLL